MLGGVCESITSQKRVIEHLRKLAYCDVGTSGKVASHQWQQKAMWRNFGCTKNANSQSIECRCDSRAVDASNSLIYAMKLLYAYCYDDGHNTAPGEYS